MPALSPTMEEGKLARWVKREGEKIAAGDVLAEIETDKATLELEATDEGVLGKILVAEGTEGVRVNAPIAWILEEGEDAGALAGAEPAPVPVVPAAPKKAEEKPAAREAPKPQTPTEAKPAAPRTVEAQPRQESAKPGTRVFASPLARRLAKEAGFDLHAVRGTGPHGRIVKADVESVSRRAVMPLPGRPIPRAPGTMPSSKEIPNTNIRTVLAERLTKVHQEVPTFFLSIDCAIDALLSIRQQANDMLEEREKLSVNDFLIRAAALALMEVPVVNSSWEGKAIRQYEGADIAMAVATERGLITPVLRGAEAKTVREIAREAKVLAEKARAGKLRPEEFQGGTFTVSNLGMLGIRQFDAILNPPQACILAMGAGEKRPVVRDGAVAIATVMISTLTCDHRVVDGAKGAEFLAAFKRYVEEPARMLLKEAGYG
ncbi:MAG: pyruvate dehydrogenase complex dihydrolipoamide acetyltransferase [Pseudomonadota bacterium]